MEKELLANRTEKKQVDENIQEILKKMRNRDDEILKRIQQEKTETLKESIEEINKLINQRMQLNKELLTDVEKVKSEINTIIMKLGDETNKKEQIMLRQKQVEIEEAKIQEKQSCWRDTATLKKELREKTEEYKGKESRQNMINQIIGE